MKKVIALLTVLALAVALAPVPAAAGDRERHRWEGAAIAVGVLGILGAIASANERVEASVRYDYNYPQYQQYQPPCPQEPQPYYGQPQGYCPPPPPPPPPPPVTYVPGYWEWRVEWVPFWETYWVPGGHDHDGHWRPGRWDRRERGGRYERRKVWVKRDERRDGRR